MWMEMLQDIFTLCIVPLLGVVVVYVKKLIEKKTAEIDENIDDQRTKKYVDMLSQTIEECVVSTNQTYVEALKNKNAFTKEAQEEAFQLTYEKVMSILTEDAKEYLTEFYDDLEQTITTKIESAVSNSKSNVVVDQTAVATATAIATAVKEEVKAE